MARILVLTHLRAPPLSHSLCLYRSLSLSLSLCVSLSPSLSLCVSIYLSLSLSLWRQIYVKSHDRVTYFTRADINFSLTQVLAHKFNNRQLDIVQLDIVQRRLAHSHTCRINIFVNCVCVWCVCLYGVYVGKESKRRQLLLAIITIILFNPQIKHPPQGLTSIIIHYYWLLLSPYSIIMYAIIISIFSTFGHKYWPGSRGHQLGQQLWERERVWPPQPSTRRERELDQ